VLVCVGLIASLLPSLALPSSGKGLFHDNPPITVLISPSYQCGTNSYCYNGGNLNSDGISAIGSLILNLGNLYNSTWKPAINALTFNNRSATEVQVTGFGIVFEYATNGITPKYYVYAGNTSAPRAYTQDLPMNNPIVAAVVNLKVSVTVSFGFSGLFFTSADPYAQDQALNFYEADTYMHGFNQLAPQLANLSSSRILAGRLAGIRIIQLDLNVAQLSVGLYDVPSYATYIGAGTLITTTYTTTITTIVTSAFSISTTTTLSSSVPPVQPASGLYTNQFLIIVSTAIGLAVALLVIAGKKLKR